MLFRRTRLIWLAFFSILFGMSAPASADLTYDFIVVNTAWGENDLAAMTGTNKGSIRSINLPGALNSSSMAYDFAFGGPSGINWGSGNWTATDNTATNRMYGGFETQTSETYSPIWTRYTGTSNISGGQGLFANATGTGTFETILYDTGYSRPPDPNIYGYYAVTIQRLSVTLQADGPAQANKGGAAVLLLNGSENSISQTGHNEGPILSTSPSSLPPLTYEINNYTLVWPDGPPFQGHWDDSNALNDGLHGTALGVKKPEWSEGFSYSKGHSRILSGEGAYAGATGENDYEVFAVGLGTQDRIVYDYTSVVVSRQVEAVPEPKTIALLLSGLLMIAACRKYGPNWSAKRV